jgi:HAMP domain-containing protein
MSAPEKGLWSRGSSAIKNRLVMVFCALGLIAVGVNIKLILDVTHVIDSREVSTTMSPSHGAKPGNVRTEDFARGVRTRLSILLGIMVVCTGTMIYLFVSRVIFPLQAIARVTEEIAQGNLAVTAPCHHGDEVGELGHSINNLAVNFQEVLLLTGTVVGNSYQTAERIQEALERENLRDGSDVKELIAALKSELEMLGAMVKDFQFYQTRFDGQKVVAQRSRTDS